MQDYYYLLGVDKNATQEEIKQAYRRQAMKFHPDRNKSVNAEELFKDIQHAYRVLGDAEKKYIYDHSVSAHHKKSQHRSTSLKCNITLENSYEGAIIYLHDSRVKITPGIRNNTKIQVNSAIVQISILPHRIFKRTNDDLLLIVELDAVEALVGTDLKFIHLNGKIMQYRIRPGTNHDQVVKFATKGMPNPETGKYGDLLIQFKITVPHLTKEQRDLIISLKSRDLIEK